MKLIRLQTDDDNCVFDNTFNAELKIKKGSKIALKNICINKEPGARKHGGKTWCVVWC